MPEKKRPVLQMKAMVLRSGSEPRAGGRHWFMPPAAASARHNIRAPLISVHPEVLTAPVLAHECLHFAQWALRTYHSSVILRWCGREELLTHSPRVRADEAQAYLLEDTFRVATVAVEDWLGRALPRGNTVTWNGYTFTYKVGA